MVWERSKVSYMRKGWSLKELEKALKAGKIRVRTKDVGRPKHHYIHLFYTPSGKLVATTFGKFVKKGGSMAKKKKK
jgi:hypothetical protein